LFLEDGGDPVSKRNKIVTANSTVGWKRKFWGLSIVNIQPSLLPWLHSKLVSLLEAEEPAVPLSYSVLRKIPEFQDTKAGTRLYPSLQNLGIPGRAYGHHPVIHILIPLAGK